MIQENEHIIFVNQAKTAVLIQKTQALKTGIQEKKIVVTTKRCLFFQSLSNIVAELQFEIMKNGNKKNNSNKPEAKKKDRVSINQFPEHSFPIMDRQSKILINQEPTCHKYLQSLGLKNFIKSTIGIVILKNLQKHKFQLLSFPDLKDAFRFAKAIQCSKAWLTYQSYCRQNNVQINHLWNSILVDIINNDNCITLIDPDLFLTGNSQQIKSFEYLIDRISFAHTFKHRYAITTTEICRYSQQFIELFRQQTHSLIYSETGMTENFFKQIFSDKIKIENLMHIDLSKNKLNDYVLIHLQKLNKQSRKMSKFNLSHNQITLNDPNPLINFLKSAKYALFIDFSHNKINDTCIETLQKFIIFPHNPPIEEINLSFNTFSKKGAWRLFVGNKKMEKYHQYMNFIIYPIPFKQQTFPENPINYPSPSLAINYNLHSALVQQFQQQSFMKHTLHQILNPSQSVIRIIRKMPSNINLPRDKKQMQDILTLSNKIQNFIYAPQTVENIYDLAEKISKFPLNLPPTSLKRYIKYMSDKLNEALFIRDHYSVRYILNAFKVLKINYDGYLPRLKKVDLRDMIYQNNIQKILNFQADENKINNMLDQMVKEGLRLYLQGNGIQLIYYLKYCRDRSIERYLYQKFNPENYLFSRMAQRNLQLQDNINEQDLYIPYEIRVEKSINQNFYLHPWQANYIKLSRTTQGQYEECLTFINNSQKRQKFSVYIDRIQERILFMTNQFRLFSFYKFKLSYTDLKINCSRLLSMYNFITEKIFYLQIPSISRKVPITKQKIYNINNPNKFKNQYHIANYPNLNFRARNAGFYNYKKQMTKYYDSQIFQNQLSKIMAPLDSIYDTIQQLCNNRPDLIPIQISPYVKQIIQTIRQSIFPNQLKQEFYLRLLSFRNGKHMNNTQILRYMPFLTMYLRPPLPLQKYIVAAILLNQTLQLNQMHLSLATQINNPSLQKEIDQANQQYVERDWMANQLFSELIQNNGKLNIKIQLLTKQSISILIPESKTIREIHAILVGMLEHRIDDVIHYWLYEGRIGQTDTLKILQQDQYIGQVFADNKIQKKKYFVFKRRIYSAQIKYRYENSSSKFINSLYGDWKFGYLSDDYFESDERMLENASKMFVIDTVQQVEQENTNNPSNKVKVQQALNLKMKKLKNHYKKFIPPKCLKRSLIVEQELLAQLQGAISQLILSKQHTKTLQLKLKILKYYQNFPQFLNTCHIMMDRNRKNLKVCINIFRLYLESQDEIQSIQFQKILKVIPKMKYLLIYYHKHESTVGQINIVGDENKILGIAYQLLTYCAMRCKISSLTLYNAYRYQNLRMRQIKQKSLEQKSRDEKRRIEKKLKTFPLSLLENQNIVYLQPSKYIKVFSQRKLYSNASNKNLLIQNQQAQINNQSYEASMQFLKNHNVFQTIFPKLANHLSSKQPSNKGKSDHINTPLESPKDKQSIYDSMEPYSNKPQIPDSNVNNIEQSQTPINDQFSPITNANRRGGRLPPKKRS